MQTERRRGKLVYPRIQVTMVARMLIYWLAFSVCLCLVLSVLQFCLDPLAPIQGTSPQYRSHQINQLQLTIISVGIVMFCLLPAFIWDSIQFSHRFVGPIIRLHSQIRKAADAPQREISLRSQDFWHDLIGDFNRLMAQLEPRRQVASSELAASGLRNDGEIGEFQYDVSLERSEHDTPLSAR